MPPLLLDDDEAVTIAVGLRAAAAGTVTGIDETSLRALTKLEQALSTRLRHPFCHGRRQSWPRSSRGCACRASPAE